MYPFQNGCYQTSSENDVLVILITEQVFALDSIFDLGILVLVLLILLLSGLSGCLFSCSVLLFLVGDFLQTVEFFTVELIQLRIDVLDCILSSRNDDVLTVTGLVLAVQQDGDRRTWH